MKKSLVTLSIILVSLLGTSSTHPQTAASRKNLNSCLRGYTGCDLSQLTSDEQLQVANAAHQRNFNSCMRGYFGCDLSKLTDTENPLVQQATHQRNFNNCLHGYFGCDPSELSNDELPAVQRAALDRNLNNCLRGYFGCDASKLPDDERERVEKAAHQRNFNNCLRGYFGCDLSKLSSDELNPVREAAKQRNFNNCLNGYFGCDASALSADEIAKIQSSKNGSTAQSNRAATAQETPRYYTNKDGIRVQSPTHYDSRPAGATAQCADGTYSFSLNHRGTCSHHGGVSKWLDRSPTSSVGQPGVIRRTFAGYACTSNCSGHEAGYRWAEEHDIDDTDACDAAGDHSNSPSFAEGCRAFVEGEAKPDDSEESDEPDSDPNGD